jgi:hypothetical protein
MQQIISKAEKMPLITHREPHSIYSRQEEANKLPQRIFSQRGRLQQQGTENKSS